jgi:hypothetical protein
MIVLFYFNRSITVVMSGTHFYVALPSNASLAVFPNNTATSYRVKLPQTIDLDGNWEVGTTFKSMIVTLRCINAWLQFR